MCNVTRDYCICFNCFHIFKYSDTAKNIDKKSYNEEFDRRLFLEYLFKELEGLIESKGKINIASIDGCDTILLDLIKSRFSGNVRTTSISEKFNPSYFSDHKCYKFSLDMYVNMDNYDTFDVIILNGSLDYISDPISLLKKCKMICNNSGYIYSIILHVSVLFSLDYINTITTNIWTTHSVKKLCQYSEMLLSDIFKVSNSNDRIYKICKDIFTDKLVKPILEELYDEICQGFYNIERYDYIKQFWTTYIEMCNKVKG